jgi:hypothetical protein
MLVVCGKKRPSPAENSLKGTCGKVEKTSRKVSIQIAATKPKA